MTENIIDKDYNTPYDDAYRTMFAKCPRFIIPVINEMFDEDYSGSEEIEQTPNEFFVSEGNGEDRKIITDSVFAIVSGLKKKYHVECQSNPDGSILIRIFEYDVQAAIEDSTTEGSTLTLRFPHSGILYLRNTDKTPPVSTIRIETPDGEVEYRVHSLMVKDYNIGEIFSKDLLFLIPFHIFAYEKRLDIIDDDAVECESLAEHYEDIMNRIESLAEEGQITDYEKMIIMELSWKVFRSVVKNHDNVRKAGRKVMGGRVLELEADRVMAKLQAHYNKGKEEDRDESARIYDYLEAEGRLDEYKKALRDTALWNSLLQEAQNNA